MPPPHAEVLICRGCCCGTDRKHPGTDHERQVATLTQAATACPTARVRTVGCLGPCSHSNVVVVRPVGRAGEAVWLGRMNTHTQTASLAGWLEAGADLEALPPELVLFDRFDPDAVARERAARRAAG